MRNLRDIEGLLTIKGLSVKVSKKYILLVDVHNQEHLNLGFKVKTWSGTNSLKTGQRNLRQAIKCSVLSPLNPQLVINE
jgi:hypothetical protein